MDSKSSRTPLVNTGSITNHQEYLTFTQGKSSCDGGCKTPGQELEHSTAKDTEYLTFTGKSSEYICTNEINENSCNNDPIEAR